MKFAIIKNGVIINVIEKDNEENIIAHMPFGTSYVNITGMSPEPGKDWLYNGKIFTPPSFSTPENIFDTDAAANDIITNIDLPKLKADEVGQAILAILYKLKLVTEEVE